VGTGPVVRGAVQLTPTNWDDWFDFATLYQAAYVGTNGDRHEIGGVKIGEFGLIGRSAKDYQGERGYRQPTLPSRFERIGDQHFSLGQDTSYYENLTEIGPEFREEYLRAMNDIALNKHLLARAETEEVTRVSLLRDVPLQTVRDQFGRLAVGQPRLTAYDFKFAINRRTKNPCRLTFEVVPNSRPPTNIHVLIGRNGVGKSWTLNGIATSIVEGSRQQAPDPFETKSQQWQQLSNLVSVSFSAFDSFTPISESRDRTKGLTYHYVGLRKKRSKVTPDAPVAETKDPAQLSREMTLAAKTCLVGARRNRWRQALRILEGDPIFASLGLVELIDSSFDDDEVTEGLPGIFKKLSSGHKIVLLTITKLVETVEEKSLVLLDEPESHLHPPLLSAFVRALSDLLTDRNGLAIVASHSPVVLQEVPKSCVWKLQRFGNIVSAERPTIETFGENVGTLTDDVFGLEVNATGFHTMLAEAASQTINYQTALDMFDGELGAEGRAILRAMITARTRSVGA
jgi:predicted ATPase